jgi:predicted AlkP superfamily pyrophosphatase or phosphodiesterase
MMTPLPATAGASETLPRGPLLAAFIDGLRPDSVEHMPFVSTISRPARVRTEFGYSITCHPSMYTGVWPDQHLSWFIWKRDPEHSPFRWLNHSGIDRLPDSNYLKYPLWRITHQFKRNSAWFSVPFPAFFPLRQWHEFDVTEKKFWDEDGFNPHFPTIFEIFRKEGVTTRIVGMNRQAPRAAEQLLSLEPEFADFTYLFFGDIDSVSHRHCQDSPEGRKRLRLVDRAIERWYRAAERRHGEPTFLLWSDHGHIPVEEKVDVRAAFRGHGLELRDFTHVVDSNYLRLWFRNDAERSRAERVIPDLGKGFIVTPEVAKRYHVDMPDNRYGDLIYYLEAPAMFHKGTFDVFGRRMSSKDDKSMHGYSPDNPGVDATLVANRGIRLSRTPILQDIPPTLLRHFGLTVPPYMVGAPLW